MMTILEVLDSNLQYACERVEAGFYFEEGGCYGMALSLQDVLAKAGVDACLAVRNDCAHAVVIVGGKALDYTGMQALRGTEQTMTREGFIEMAHLHGHSDEDLFSAQEWANQAIAVALESCQASLDCAPDKRLESERDDSASFDM